MSIQGIKLVTGEELVAKVTFVEGNHVFIDNPLVLMMGRGKDGGILINFMPWTVIAEGTITLQAHAIVARYPVPKDVEDSYIQNTTGIQIVSGSTSQLLQG